MTRIARRDWAGLLLVALLLGGLIVFRRAVIDPREWGAICVAPTAPAVCMPRAALLWLGNLYLWGTAALVLGMAAFRFRAWPVAVAGVAVGAIAVASYNASWGMVGLALGAWTWMTLIAERPRPAA